MQIRDAGAAIASGNAIKSSTMEGLSLTNSANDTTSLGLWFGTNESHWCGISGQRTDTGTWGTDLRFYTHEDATSDLEFTRERMRISPSGKVGIGVAPVAKLHIDASATGDNKSLYIQHTHNTDGDSAAIRFGFAGNDNANKGGIFFKRTANYGRGSLIFATENTQTNDNVDNSDARLTILADGTVGIATAAPSSTYKLDVVGSVRTSATLSASTVSASTANFSGAVAVGSLSHLTIAATGSQDLLILKDTNATGNGASPYIRFKDSGGTNLGYIGYGSTDHGHMQFNNGGGGDFEFNSGNVTFSGTITAPSVTLTGTGGTAAVFAGDVSIYKAGADQKLYLSEGSAGVTNVQLNPNGVSYLKGGNVAIGSADPGSYKLYVNGTTMLKGDTEVDGAIGVGDAPAAGYKLYVNGHSRLMSHTDVAVNSNTNLRVNGATHAGETWDGAIHIKKSSTIGNETSDEVVLYAEDVTEGGVTNCELRVMDDDRNRTTLSSHINGKWVYKSDNTKTGKSVKIHMEDLVKAVEEHLGMSFSEIVEGSE